MPKGYIQLDSLAAKILRALHENGKMRYRDIMELFRDEGVSRANLGGLLGRLCASKYVYRHGKTRGESGTDRLQQVYSLQRSHEKVVDAAIQSGAERSKRWRERKKLLANSVFTWRPPAKCKGQKQQSPP